jgi:hypothetical protein
VHAVLMCIRLAHAMHEVTCTAPCPTVMPCRGAHHVEDACTRLELLTAYAPDGSAPHSPSRLTPRVRDTVFQLCDVQQHWCRGRQSAGSCAGHQHHAAASNLAWQRYACFKLSGLMECLSRRQECLHFFHQAPIRECTRKQLIVTIPA